MNCPRCKSELNIPGQRLGCGFACESCNVYWQAPRSVLLLSRLFGMAAGVVLSLAIGIENYLIVLGIAALSGFLSESAAKRSAAGANFGLRPYPLPRCPDCSGSLRAEDVGEMRCRECSRAFLFVRKKQAWFGLVPAAAFACYLVLQSKYNQPIYRIAASTLFMFLWVSFVDITCIVSDSDGKILTEKEPLSIVSRHAR